MCDKGNLFEGAAELIEVGGRLYKLDEDGVRILTFEEVGPVMLLAPEE